MENLLNVAQNVVVLYILMACGFICNKKSILDQKSVKAINEVILYFVTPCVIINSFLRDKDEKLFKGLLIMFAASVCFYIVTIALSFALIHDKEKARLCVLRFGAVFSNCGFFGLPMQQAIMGDIGVFYGSVFVAVFNLFTFSYGYIYFGGKENMSVKKAVLNPGVIGLTIGMILFFTGLSNNIPSIISRPVGFLASMNTPLAMLIIGFYIAQLKIKDFVGDGKMWYVMGIRMVLFPALFLFTMIALGIKGEVLVVSTISVSSPMAAMTTMLATKFDRDALLASKMVSVSTMLCIITLPVMVFLAQMFA